MPPSSGKAEVFTDPDYGGASAALEEGDYTVGAGTGQVGNDTISSVKVAAGWAVLAYDNSDFTGDSQRYTVDTPTLGALDNKISSLRVVVDAPDTPAPTTRMSTQQAQQVVFVQPPSYH